MDTDPQKSADRARAVPWIAGTSVVLAALGLVAYLKACQGTHEVAQVAEHAVATVKTGIEALPAIAAKFQTGTITHTFIEQNTVIAPTRGNVLEVATVQSTESFESTDTRRVFWDMINLGTTSSEIRCPVTFRYHVLLSDRWRLATRDHTCLVLAPLIRPSLPPAIHTDRLEKHSNEDWLRFNGEENLQELERSLTPELDKRANDPPHRALAREACRQAVADFVKGWLLKEDQWREDRLSTVVVVFPDEEGFASDEELATYQAREPTITLKNKN